MLCMLINLHAKWAGEILINWFRSGKDEGGVIIVILVVVIVTAVVVQGLVIIIIYL